MSKSTEIIKNYLSQGKKVLTEFESKELLEKIGISITKQKLTSDKNDTVKFADEIGYPVVMKLMADDVVHKSDAGAVKLNIQNKDEIEKSFDELMSIPSKSEKKINIQKMADEPITEIIIGMTTDPQFGPALMFGIGGILVELLEDVSFRIAPIEKFDANEMIHEIKGFPLLDGFRGKPKADIDAIIDALLKVSDLVIQNPEIYEMDLNPIFVYNSGIVCVDARIILKD